MKAAVSSAIEKRIVDAILAGRVRPGTRLGEQALADLFDVSRTRVREAMMRLEARGIVRVSARRGWFVIEPTIEEAHDVFEARRALETGLLLCVDVVPEDAVGRLKRHIAEEKAAIAGGDVGLRSYLLGDFHVCMAEALGNRLIADILRDLTARTVLIAMLYQSTHDASQSCCEHEEIVAALAEGDREGAANLMARHVGHVEAALGMRVKHDPLSGLRDALAPLSTVQRRSGETTEKTEEGRQTPPQIPQPSRGETS